MSYFLSGCRGILILITLRSERVNDHTGIYWLNQKNIVPDSSKRLTAHTELAKRGLVANCQNNVNTTIIVAKHVARTYYLNLIYFCRKHTMFTIFYEFMLQKMLKFANYAAAVLVYKIMLFCSNYAKNYASTFRQGQAQFTQMAPQAPRASWADGAVASAIFVTTELNCGIFLPLAWRRLGDLRRYAALTRKMHC